MIKLFFLSLCCFIDRILATLLEEKYKKFDEINQEIDSKILSYCNISRIRQTILDDPQDNPKCPRHHPDVQPGENQQHSPKRAKSGTLCNYTITLLCSAV